VNPLVKICGVTQQVQAEAIADAGADFVGLNFWPGSKRFLDPGSAAPWVGELSKKAQLIGVFVNPQPRHLEPVLDAMSLAALQLHGDETPQFCAEWVKKGHRLIKAFQVRDAASLDQIESYDLEDILLDTYHFDQRGGTGETFPWELAREFLRRYPDRKLWLSGGLTPANVAAAAQGVRPFALDVASGVEAGTPGVKDLEKVVAFIRAAKEQR
jgi:phosphoribosylanthranilate isomerase